MLRKNFLTFFVASSSTYGSATIYPIKKSTRGALLSKSNLFINALFFQQRIYFPTQNDILSPEFTKSPKNPLPDTKKFSYRKSIAKVAYLSANAITSKQAKLKNITIIQDETASKNEISETAKNFLSRYRIYPLNNQVKIAAH